MKKVLLVHDLKDLLMVKNGILNRSDITVFTASTNDEMLRVHRREEVDLIITQLDLPGIKSENLFAIIRNSMELRQVSTIILCKDTLAHRERCKQCGANAVFTLPLDTALLQIRMQQFLNVAPRMAYRAALAVAISGKFKDKPLPFRTENVSASGILISAEEPLSKGDAIFFSFFLSDGAHVSGYGEIARVERVTTSPDTFHYGIRFTNVSPDVQAAIEAAVKK